MPWQASVIATSKKPFFALLSLTLLPLGVYWWIAGTHTRYAPEFSERGLAKIAVGMGKSEVLLFLGPPLQIQAHSAGEEWCYPPSREGVPTAILGPSATPTPLESGWCVTFGVEGVVDEEFRDQFGMLDRDEFRTQFGAPAETWPAGLEERLFYSRPLVEGMSWQWREVDLRAGNVRRIISAPVYE